MPSRRSWALSHGVGGQGIACAARHLALAEAARPAAAAGGGDEDALVLERGEQRAPAFDLQLAVLVDRQRDLAVVVDRRVGDEHDDSELRRDDAERDDAEEEGRELGMAGEEG
jgi:hypothetical protein